MRDGQEPSVLDIVLSNEAGMVKNLEVHAALGKSDHAVLTLDFQSSWYGKGDYEKLRKMRSGTDWGEQLHRKNSLTSMGNRQITARSNSSQLHTKEDYSTERCTQQETMEHVGQNRES